MQPLHQLTLCPGERLVEVVLGFDNNPCPLRQIAHSFHEHRRVAVVPPVVVAEQMPSGEVEGVAVFAFGIPEILSGLRSHDQTIVFHADIACPLTFQGEFLAHDLFNRVGEANLLQIDTHKTSLLALCAGKVEDNRCRKDTV